MATNLQMTFEYILSVTDWISGNDLVLNKSQAITWKNYDLIHRYFNVLMINNQRKCYSMKTRTTRAAFVLRIPPATSLLPILLSHIKSQVKRRQSQSYKFKEYAKISNFETNITRDTPSEVA